MKQFLILFSLFLVLSLDAIIINIPSDQSTIQEGINVAVNGDTVLVAPGAYVENIDFNGKDITVASFYITTQDTTYISQTVIDGNQNGSVVKFINFESTDCELCGFTLQNGLNNEPENQGGGILVNQANPYLHHLRIKENSAYSGGGIAIISASPFLSNLVIKDNQSSSYGGGLYFHNSNNISMTNLTVSFNISDDDGAGLYLSSCDSIIVNNSILLLNTCGHNGGNISISGSELTLYHTSVIQGHCFSYGGGIQALDSSLHLVNTDIASSSSSFHGGIYASNSQINISESIFRNNGGEYGGAFGVFNSDMVVTNSIFHDNGCYSGGNLYFGNTDAVFINSTICNNSAQLDSGGLAGSGNIKLINSIVYGNSGPQFSSNHIAYYSLMQGQAEGVGNFDAIPLFIDAEAADFQLQDSSPCLGAGIEEIEIDGQTYTSPEFDILGNLRPNPVGSIPDIGAFENSLSEPQVCFDDNQIYTSCFNLTNHPNPFNPSTQVSFSLNTEITENTEIEIFNVKGQKVKSYPVTLSGVEGRQTNSVTWNGTDQSGKPVSSGIYLIKLKSGDKTLAQKKCLLLK